MTIFVLLSIPLLACGLAALMRTRQWMETIHLVSAIGSFVAALFLIGFFMMVNRRKALTQVLALLSLENGIFLAAISLTYGMPMIVELGIFFDFLVAGMVLAILVYRIRETFDSTDVSRLSRLKG